MNSYSKKNIEYFVYVLLNNSHNNNTLHTSYYYGAIAQMGEHLLCKQGVVGSIPTSSTEYQNPLK